MDKGKAQLLVMVSNGRVQDVIEELLSRDLVENERKQAIAIGSRYERIQSRRRAGTLSFENADLLENQVVEQLISLISSFDDQIDFAKKSTILTVQNKKEYHWNKLILIPFLIFFLGLFLYFLFPVNRQTYQLTIHVTDTKGNIVLEHEGELNTAIGNRSMRKKIGENGRTNFGDLLSRHLGDSISIGFRSDGWELANPNNTFVFDGSPIHLKIKENNSIGLVKGVIKTINGQDFIEGAKILVNADTVIFSNLNGIFKVLLPKKMRVESITDPYQLTVSKKGYKTVTQYYFPKSVIELRLEKQ